MSHLCQLQPARGSGPKGVSPGQKALFHGSLHCVLSGGVRPGNFTPEHGLRQNMFMPISSSPHGGGPRPGGGNIFSSGGGGGSNQHSSCSPIPTPRFVTKPMMSDVIRYVQLFRYGEQLVHPPS